MVAQIGGTGERERAGEPRGLLLGGGRLPQRQREGLSVVSESRGKGIQKIAIPSGSCALQQERIRESGAVAPEVGGTGICGCTVQARGCYYFGYGVPKSLEKAAYWFKKAAEQGDAGAQYSLGACYYLGYGVPKSREKAVYWYKKAAEQGLQEAKDALRALGLGS